MRWHEPPYTLREMKIEVTQKCPLNCRHCSSDATPAAAVEMDAAQCRDLITEAASMGVRDVAFSGGEPLWWDGLADVVTLSSSLNLNATIYTSGNVAGVAARLRSLKEAGLARCIFSLFGCSADSHELITTTRGSFERTVEAIRESVATNMSTEIHFVPMGTNYRELPAVVELASELGVTTSSVLRLVPQGRAQLLKGQQLTHAQYLHLRRMIGDLRARGHNVRTGSPFNFLMVNDNPKCSSGIDRLIIGPDLAIYPCDAFKQVSAVEIVGTDRLSVVGRDPLSDCWSGSPYLQAVRAYLTTDFAETCGECDDLEQCLSGCLAQKFLVTGSLAKIADPACLLGQGE